MRPCVRRAVGPMIGLTLAVSAMAVAPAHSTSPTASIVGHVTTTPIGGSTPSISTGLDVWLYTADGVFVKDTVTDPEGDYTFTGLDAGDYTIRFENQNEGVEEWWWNAPNMESSTALTLGKSQQVRADAHITAVAENLTAPTITGTAAVGTTLSAANGTWFPLLSSGGISVTRQWLRDGNPISGATGTTYTLTNADAGAAIAVRIIASRDGMQEQAVSAPTAPVTGGTTVSVTSVTAPAISGSAVIGSTLTADTGVWQPSSATVARQWLRNGNPISGATGTTYVVTASDAGATISLRVTASAPGHTSTTVTSAGVTVGSVVSPPTVVTAPRVSGTTRVGGMLTASPGTWSATPTATSYAWLRNGSPIDGATAATYRPTRADVGRSLSARVTVTTPGGTASAGSSAVRIAKAAGSAKLKLSGKKGRIKATFTLTSTGARSGKVTFTVKAGKKSVRRIVKLKAGTAKVTLTKVPKGTRKVVAKFAGNPSTSATKVAKKAKVR